MKEKTDRNKQLAEVLPNTRRVILNLQLGKRKPTAIVTSESTLVKKPKFAGNFKTPKRNFGDFNHLVNRHKLPNHGRGRKFNRKNAIEIVHQAEIDQGFNTTLFLVPKKTGDLIPVINCETSQPVSEEATFQNDTLTKVLNLVKP
ncbi:Hypothetical predicted protein [Mytilus galloprovincialis]|uniref:Uncharacterized protein n=1 Tax=Mytilus galloprovincialis TaxID=29158 RepID=A0A8B6D7V0_MYTGA|nr:Hypothetical predicted protein [Mytilus galloprovincialis]